MSDKELHDKLAENGEITPEMEREYKERAPFWMFANDEEYDA